MKANNNSLEFGAAGMNLLKFYEGFSEKAYLDPVSIWTIGYGTIMYPDGTRVKQGDVCTVEEAEEYLKYKLTKFENDVKRLVKVDLNQYQYDALVSLVYNIGPGNFEKSTLLKKLNLKDYSSAAEQFLVWRKAGGKVLNGLVKRRIAEKELFEKEEQIQKYFNGLNEIL